MATTKKNTKRSKKAVPGKAQQSQFVQYTWDGSNYTLDLVRDRVYKNWMAVETNKGFTILGSYRTKGGGSHASV